MRETNGVLRSVVGQRLRSHWEQEEATVRKAAALPRGPDPPGDTAGDPHSRVFVQLRPHVSRFDVGILGGGGVVRERAKAPHLKSEPTATMLSGVTGNVGVPEPKASTWNPCHVFQVDAEGPTLVRATLSWRRSSVNDSSPRFCRSSIANAELPRVTWRTTGASARVVNGVG